MQKRKKGEWLIWLGAEGTKRRIRKKVPNFLFSLSLLFLVFGYSWPKHRSSQKKLKRGKVFWLHTRYVQFGPTLAASNSQQKEKKKMKDKREESSALMGLKSTLKRFLFLMFLLLAPHCVQIILTLKFHIINSHWRPPSNDLMK